MTTHTNPATPDPSDDAASSRPGRLGVWHNPNAEYVYGLGQSGTIAAVIGLLAVFAAFIPPDHKPRNIAITLLVAAVAVGPFAIRDRWGRNLITIANHEARWAIHRATGRNLHTAPPWLTASSTQVTGVRLPGLLSNMSIAEHQLDDTTRYAVIHHPASNTVSVVIECRPAGDTLADPDTTTGHVNAWERWLAAMADEPHLAAIQIVTEAAPTHHNPNTSDDSDDGGFCGRVLAETLEACTGRIGTRTWVTVSWATPGRTRTALTSDVLPARVERLCTALTEAGAGPTTPVSQEGLAVLWAGMYDPDRRQTIAEHPDTPLDLVDAIPVTAVERRHRYELGPVDAVSLTMGAPPDRTVTTAVHKRLARGVDGAETVRWALLLRPVPSGEAREWTARIQRAIDTRLAFTGDRRPKIADQVADDQTTSTATTLAHGHHALTRVAFALTLTLPAGADTAGPIERVRNAVAPLTPHLRVMDGAHQTSWVATLPGGVPIPEALGVSEGLNQ
ncbi:MAG: SCO6880 family protein [Acidimicrobiales bacterium]